jgi:lipoprotein-releasing system permease protein
MSNLLIKIAKELLLARWKQTLVAAIGVTFSISMFVTLLSFMNGLNDLLDGLILNRTAHVRIYNEVKPSKKQVINLSNQYKDSYNFINSVKSSSSRQSIYNTVAIFETLNKDPRILGYAPKINAQVFFTYGTLAITGSINGIEVAAESKLFSFKDYVTAGKAIDLKNVPNSIILGKGLAEKLMANIGDVVQINTTDGNLMPLKVVGVFQSGLKDLDLVQSYTSVATAQKLMGKSNNYLTDIQVKLKDINQAPKIAKEYALLFDCDAEDIQTANSQFETGSTVRTIISYAVGVVLLIVAGFGIFNILNMLIYEKMDTIAILKATGFSGMDVKKIFIYIALSIGIFGGLFGIIFGFGFSVIIDNIPFNTPSLPTIKTFPINYKSTYYIIGIIFSMVTTYMAGFFPARKASKIDPVTIIRGK